MKLNILSNYKSVNASLKLITIIVLIGAFVFCSAIFIFSWQKLTSAKNTIYVIDANGNTYSASGKEQSLDTRKFEYEDHIKDFYKLWYQFDQNSYQRNIDAALMLAGECGKELYNEYKAEDTKNVIESKNISLSVEITEIKLDMNQHPVVGYIKGIQTIKRLNGEVKRNMNCTFSIYDVDRSQENSHGCKIENWKVIDNSEIIEE